MLANNVGAEANRVLSFDPTDVSAIVELGVVAIIRHEVVLRAEESEGRQIARIAAADIKLRPASFKIARAVDSRNAEDIGSLFLRNVKLLGVGDHPCHTENRVHDENRGGNIAAGHAKADGVSVSSALVADETADLRSPDGAENLRINGIVLCQTKMAVYPEFLGGVPVNLGVGREAVEQDVRRAEVVVIGHILAGAGKIRRGHHGH